MNKGICCLCHYDKNELISKTVRDSKTHRVFKCKKCKHIQLFPIPSLTEEKNFYDNNLQDKNINFFGGIKENRIKSLEDTLRRVEFIKKQIPKNGKILEIGSGHGFFLEQMEKLNYKITGIEISSEKRKMAKRITNAKILSIDLINHEIDIKNFDMIVMFHVLEHLSKPSEFLKKISLLLKSKGKIILEVPNSNDFQLSINPDYKKFYWQRAHLHYFNPKTLNLVIKKAGLNSKIIGIQRYSIENMFNWKFTKKPQLYKPTFELSATTKWIDDFYKYKLEKDLKSDTIIAICSKIN